LFNNNQTIDLITVYHDNIMTSITIVVIIIMISIITTVITISTLF